MSLQHNRFLVRLEGSEPAVQAVADWLRRKGRTAFVKPLRFAPSAADWPDYADDGDIITDGGKIVEVKGLNKDFMPWPFDEALIASKASVDRSRNVVAYVFLSRDLQCAGVVLPNTRDRWYIVESYRGNTGNVEISYACPNDCVIWKRLLAPSPPAQSPPA